MRALPYLGVVLLWAACALAVWFAVEQALELDDTRLEGTRTPIPGQRTLDLDARKYNVFFEGGHARSGPGGDALDDPEATPLRIRIRGENGDRVLSLDGYSGTFTLSGGRDGTAIATVRVPRSGRYRMTVTSSEELGYSSESVALGEPPGRRVVKLVGGLVLAAVAFLSGALILIVTLVVRSQRRA